MCPPLGVIDMHVQLERIPLPYDLHQLMQGADLDSAKAELDKAKEGQPCHEAVLMMLQENLEELPQDPPDVEPAWLRNLLFAILSHRKHQGV